MEERLDPRSRRSRPRPSRSTCSGPSRSRCSHPSCPRHSKLNKCARRNLGEDRISCLSDDILIIILSLLPLEQAIKTSLLSRRWLNLWMHTSVLDFYAPLPKEPPFKINQKFINRVNGVLLRHKGVFLNGFKIFCQLDITNREDIDRWLEFALARKVEHLEFNLLMATSYPNKLSNKYVLPKWLVNPSSGKLDSHVGGLKRLRSLSLKSVDVSDKDVGFFLVNCPLLERLEVVGSMQLVNLVISDTTLVLKYLCLKYCTKLKVISISNFNLVTLELDIQFVDRLTLRDLPMLVDMSMLGTGPFSSTSFANVSCFSRLKSLTLDAAGDELKTLARIPNHLYRLTKLKRLVIRGSCSVDESLTCLIPIINASPQLEEFVLRMQFYRGDAERLSTSIYDGLNGKSSLKIKRLKVFKFVGYCGRGSDVELINLVARKAVSLEKIIIDPRDYTNVSVPYPHEAKIKRHQAENEENARDIALKQCYSLRESLLPNVDFLIR